MELKALEWRSTRFFSASDNLEQVIDFAGDMLSTVYDPETGLFWIEADDSIMPASGLMAMICSIARDLGIFDACASS